MSVVEGSPRKRRYRMGHVAFAVSLVSLVWAGACAAPTPTPALVSTKTTPTPPQAPSYTATMRADLPATQATVASAWVKDVLGHVLDLPPRAPRAIWRDKARGLALSSAQHAVLPPDEAARFTSEVLDDASYYAKYSSPLAYARALDLAAAHGLAGVDGRAIADFGYGDIGHLQMLAHAGADIVGVDVNPLLSALYSEPEDTGPVGRGVVRIVEGRWPLEPAHALVGGPFDLFLSKNTLKRGYVHPQEEADPNMLIDLGVNDDTFLSAVHDATKPGALVVLYNLCPAPAAAGQPSAPWSDGHSPFTETQWKAHGFEVLAFDVDDSEQARALGRALRWDAGDDAMDLEHDLFAWFTVLRRAH